MENHLSNSGSKVTDAEEKDIDAISACEASYRKACYELGYENGQLFVDNLKKKDTDKIDYGAQQLPSLFAEMAGMLETEINQHIRKFTDEAVDAGARANLLITPQQQQDYAEALHKDREEIRHSEFFGKSLWLYIGFGFLLCIGDILLGDYLAKEVLKAGNAAEWKGFLLGVFCIALGVIIEIVINNLYTKINKRAFNIIIIVIPILTLFMFTGMGVLRAASFNIQADMSGFSTIPFPPWAITTFFIGLSLAAPTALGCVLFIVQKRIRLGIDLKKTTVLLEKTGAIINAEQLLEKNRRNYEKDLKASYEVGFQKGRNEAYSRKPEPAPKQEPEPMPSGSLANNLMARMLRKHGFKLLIPLFFSCLLLSCSSKPGVPVLRGEKPMKYLVFMGLSKENVRKVLETETGFMEQESDYTVIWPGGAEEYSSKTLPAGSLVAQPKIKQETESFNREMFYLFKQRILKLYNVDTDTIPVNWTEECFRLFAAISERMQDGPDEKKVILWAGKLPGDLLLKPDSLLKQEARSYFAGLSVKYELMANRLPGTAVYVQVPATGTTNNYQLEHERRMLYYLRMLFSEFGVAVMYVKTIIT